MPHTERSQSLNETELVTARAKVLAREDRELKADLIRVRQDSGLTQQQVADLLGVSQQAIQKLERYDSDPKMSTLRRYANAVGALVEHRVTPDERSRRTDREAIGALSSGVNSLMSPRSPV